MNVSKREMMIIRADDEKSRLTSGPGKDLQALAGYSTIVEEDPTAEDVISTPKWSGIVSGHVSVARQASRDFRAVWDLLA